jgi:hypothetical protein
LVFHVRKVRYGRQRGYVGRIVGHLLSDCNRNFKYGSSALGDSAS